MIIFKLERFTTVSIATIIQLDIDDFEILLILLRVQAWKLSSNDISSDGDNFYSNLDFFKA